MKKRKKTILLLEDEPEEQKMIKLRLQSEGYEVITANNGV